ncbi:MAG: hypothetical protein Q8S03_14030 [Brevundimonas sp.]|uniref:hypothetical protein n=1 Tax=Brevundimonas sp. TaxID=1871086 RepID=UPI0027352C04|nr:hypothetical protein [Brevundimonas sp.]MDP3405809.1 hypothetical protein [Brevundimonas sp.]
MPRLRFEDLLELYRHTAFDPSGDEGILTIASPQALASLQLIETDEAAGDDANLAVLVDEANLSVGQTVRVRVGAPRIGLGLLVRSVNDLLKAPEARVAEPAAYFVIDGGIDARTTPAPALIETYRQVLAVVDLLSKAAAYLDKTRQELVFVHDGKVPVPVRYDQAVLERVSATAITGLLENFRDDVHQDQKLAILEDAVVQMIEGQSTTKRFVYLLDNLDALNESVRKGYRLFASSFSYKKIRGEIEAAKVEYVGKIHKTLVDIQVQLLSIPVATIIVASQLKVSPGCGVEFWTNIAVVAGAWVFLCLLLIAITNQWVTLGAIHQDVKAQQQRLERDYAAISPEFARVFQSLLRRILWHRVALSGIGFIAVLGALFATYAYGKLNTAPAACLTSAVNPTPVETPAHPTLSTPVQPPLSGSVPVGDRSASAVTAEPSGSGGTAVRIGAPAISDQR